MNPFSYHRATSLEDALLAVRAGPPAQGMEGDDGGAQAPRFLAGGTNLVDLMKEGVMAPSHLVDLGRLGLTAIAPSDDGGLCLGALATNAATANHPLVRAQAPLLRSAILAGASPQIRNRATNGGNLLQRTRCVYFYDPAVPCNKRLPGSGCPATSGLARQHAILGANAHCIATHPSDLCVALAALAARVHVLGAGGGRVIPFEDFHRLPGDRPDLDTHLQPGELVTHIEIPPNGFATHHCYLKVRERASYAFALVSVAAALDLDEHGSVRDARLALGGVAHKPWRDLEAEQLLKGGPATEDRFLAAARHLLRQARAWGAPTWPDGQPGNQFKIPLAERAIVRALALAAAGIPTNTGEDFHRLLGEQDGRAPGTERP